MLKNAKRVELNTKTECFLECTYFKDDVTLTRVGFLEVRFEVGVKLPPV